MPPPPPPKPPVTRAAEPRRRQVFDAWNSSSTGHQRAENRLGHSTGWRDTRNAKLAAQFADGGGGGGKQRLFALTEAEQPVVGGAGRGGASVADMLARPGTMNRNLGRNSSSGGNDRSASSSTRTAALSSGVPPDAEGDGGRQRQEQRKAGPEHRETAGAKRQEGEEVAEEGGGEEKAAAAGPRPRRIFDGVVVYVNGSTHPLISDHRLKRVLAEHGGRLSTHLGRRQVTHVILGKPAANNGPSGSGNNGSGSANGHDKGAGGGLAGGKLQREIQRLRSAGGGGAGGGVRFVGVEWVLESVARGRRLPEARFATDVRVGAARAQRSVLDVYTAKRPPPPEKKAPADGDGGGGGIGSGTPAVDGES